MSASDAPPLPSQAILPHDQLCRHIGRWHAVHPAFVAEVIRFFLVDCRDDIATLQDLLAAYPDRAVQLEYAFSTNVRGAALRDRLLASGIASAELGEKRYLDIGCAYGGFLKAFAEVGYSVHGVEYDAALAGLCRMHMLAADIPAAVLEGDFLSEVLGDEPAFDLVTCNDVIEHVSDPRRCLGKIYAVLKPGGSAYVETVNRRSLRNVTSDIHFQMFGLNLLDHHRASSLYRQLTGWHTYGVSEFYPIEWYLNVARSLGAVVDVVRADTPMDHRTDLQAAFTRFGAWRETEAGAVDPFLADSVEAEFLAFMEEYFGALRLAHRTAALPDFHHTYSDPLIRFTLRKPAGAMG